MPIELLTSLLLTIFAVGYTPGPANIYALSCSLIHGRKNSMKAWFGMLCGFSINAIVAAILMHYVGIIIQDYIKWIKYLGVAYILYLAWKTYKASISDKKESKPSFKDGFIVQLTNAKMILFILTVYSSFVLPYSNELKDLLSVGALLLIAGPGANLLWIIAGGFLKPFVTKYQKAVDIVLSLALVGAALMILK